MNWSLRTIDENKNSFTLDELLSIARLFLTYPNTHARRPEALWRVSW